MKRILAFLLTVVLTLFCSVTAFAMELDDDTKQTHVDVYANHVNNTAWNVVSVDVSGNGSTTLSDGAQIIISGVTQSGWQLAIDPITERDALDWIGGILNGKAKDLSPLHIYFIDGYGNTKTADSVTVTVKLPENPNAPVAYSLSSEGAASGMTVSMENGSLTFTTDGSPYYVLGEKVNGETSTPSEPGNSPQTGDDNHMALWITLLFVSGAGVIGTTVYGKKKRVR